MNLVAIIGAFVITFSLLSYGIGTITISRFKIVSIMVLLFLSLGVIFDVSAIVLMIIGSSGTPFTFHGFVGYLVFLVMLINTLWAWRIYFKKGLDAKISGRYLMYSRYTYLLWVLGYLTGSLMILWR